MVFNTSSCAHAQRVQHSKGSAIAVLLATLLVLCSVPSLLAQSPSYPNFNSTANLVLNGNAAQVGSVLRLNPAQVGQAGSAWYATQQPVAEGFSTTFTFQISNANPPVGNFPADGLAFVIQNSAAGTQALGQGGGAIGYGGTIPVNVETPGIDNSIAIEFDTYPNYPWDYIAEINPSNHVAIQSCGPNPNSVDHTATYQVGDITFPCNLAIATAPVNLADQNPHTVHVEYNPTPAVCGEICTPVMTVSIDGIDVFGAVSVDIGNTINLANPTDTVADSAFVGFTGATGALVENNDILSWIFTSHSSQTITQPAPANQFTTFNFGSYLYKVKPNQSVDALTVTEVPVDPGSFNPGSNFPGAQCITYDSTGGKCIEFHAVCNSPSNNACTNVSYDVVTSYDVPAGPPITNPGFLKATGQECRTASNTPIFDSNIITQFFQTRTDPTTKGSSKPSFSCFVAVQGVTYQPADLDILNVAAGKVRPNSNLTYVATVGNFGPSGAQGVAISNPIPSGTTYVNSALCTLTSGCSNATCTFDGSRASCLVGNLDKFGLEFMVTTVKVTAPAGTVITDTATVTSFNPDPANVPDRSWTWKTLVSNR
jgi:uncharacterized repeat protein (TIGR01451 family)